MSKRVPVIVAAVVLLAFLVYIAVSSFNGSYVTAARIGSADVTASREGNAIVTKIRGGSGVRSATFGFTSGLLADRRSEIAVTMKPGVPASQVERIAVLVRDTYGHSRGSAAGAVLEIVTPGSPTLTMTDFSASHEQLAADFTAWSSLRKSIGSAISLHLASPNVRTLAFVSKKGATFVWVGRHYALLKSLAADGFTWSNPGVCSVDDLPDVAVVSVVAQLSSIVPFVSCNSSENQSGLMVAPGRLGGGPPTALLGFLKGTKGVPFSVHAAQFAAVATVLLFPKAPAMNVGFFGVNHGKLTVLRFFTGTCADGVVTHPDKTDAVSLAILKSRGVDIVKHATLGQCSPRVTVPSPTPTPGG